MIQLKFIVNCISWEGKYAIKKAVFNKFNNQLSTSVPLRIVGVEHGNNVDVALEQTTWGCFQTMEG
jgi:hypothetical protein